MIEKPTSGPHFRHLPACLLIACGIPLLLIDLPFELAGRLHNALWNLGHLFLFCALAYMALRHSKQLRQASLLSQALVLITGTLAIGGSVELIQGLTGRTASLRDLTLDLLGVAIAFTLAQKYRFPDKKIAFYSLSLAILIVSCIPVIRISIDNYRANKEMPILADFEYPAQLQRWTARASIAITKNNTGGHRLKVDLNSTLYSGATLLEFPGNWHEYQKLSVQLTNPGNTPLSLSLRVNDQQHRLGDQAYQDRFNTSVNLDPGAHTFTYSLLEIETAPNSRAMNMAEIESLTIFSTQEGQSGTFYIDDLRLH